MQQQKDTFIHYVRFALMSKTQGGGATLSSVMVLKNQKVPSFETSSKLPFFLNLDPPFFSFTTEDRWTVGSDLEKLSLFDY